MTHSSSEITKEHWAVALLLERITNLFIGLKVPPDIAVAVCRSFIFVDETAKLGVTEKEGTDRLKEFIDDQLRTIQ